MMGRITVRKVSPHLSPCAGTAESQGRSDGISMDTESHPNTPEQDTPDMRVVLSNDLGYCSGIASH